jgi:hypothetical protein
MPPLAVTRIACLRAPTAHDGAHKPNFAISHDVRFASDS